MKQALNNPSFRIIVLSSLIVTLLFSTLTPIYSKAASQQLTPEEEKQAAELAKDLEFLFEKALIVKENGERTFDFKKLKKKYGDEYQEKFGKLESMVKSELNTSKQVKENVKYRSPVAIASSQSFYDCMIGALMDHFGVSAVTAALEGGIWGYLKKKAYKEAAELFVKFAIGTNAVGVAGMMIFYGGKCTWKTGGPF